MRSNLPEHDVHGCVEKADEAALQRWPVAAAGQLVLGWFT
jgi:hypothetical protein